MGTWQRMAYFGQPWQVGSAQLVSISPGDTLLRVHFGWGWYGDSTATAALPTIAGNLQAMGIVTTVGDGTEAVPNALTQSADQDPPTQRWIYWEVRAPKIATYDATANLVTWQDSGAQEPVDTKGMVSAKTIPTGSFLNVWASWAAQAAWDTSGNVNLWLYSSVLYQPSG